MEKMKEVYTSLKIIEWNKDFNVKEKRKKRKRKRKEKKKKKEKKKQIKKTLWKQICLEEKKKISKENLSNL